MKYPPTTNTYHNYYLAAAHLLDIRKEYPSACVAAVGNFWIVPLYPSHIPKGATVILSASEEPSDVSMSLCARYRGRD